MKGKDLSFKNVEDFVDHIVERIETDDGLFLTVIGKFEEIKDVFREIMAFDNVYFENIQIESPLMDDYEDEFVLSLWASEHYIELGCEKLKIDGEYTNPCGDETYLFDNCSSKIISLCEDSQLYFVNIDGDCDCVEDCPCKCDCEKPAEDTWELYYLIGDEITEEFKNYIYNKLMNM